MVEKLEARNKSPTCEKDPFEIEEKKIYEIQKNIILNERPNIPICLGVKALKRKKN